MRSRHSSLGVEHSLSKRKVVGSNPACGFLLFGLLSLVAEHSLCKRKVGGSTPPVGSFFSLCHSSLGVEHSLSKRKVVGSNPACGLFLFNESDKRGRMV